MRIEERVGSVEGTISPINCLTFDLCMLKGCTEPFPHQNIRAKCTISFASNQDETSDIVIVQ